MEKIVEFLRRRFYRVQLCQRKCQAENDKLKECAEILIDTCLYLDENYETNNEGTSKVYFYKQKVGLLGEK